MMRDRRHPHLIISGAVAFALFGLAFGAPRPARANGAFPDEFSVHFPPGAPNRILVGANFGLLVSDDNGATWRYTCEPWIVAGSSAAVNPEASVSFYQVTPQGVLLAAAVNITRSADEACTWPIATGLQGEIIADIFASPSDANFVLAIIAVANGSYIVASHDGGKTFDPTRLYDTEDLLTGIEIARSDPAVVYATSVRTSGGGALLLQSTNSGVQGSWTPHTIPVGSGTQPRILAVDPVDKNTVYVRLLTGVTDAIMVTTDGGQSFQTLLSINGQFTSFLRATDGTLYVGTAGGQLYVRPAGTTEFLLPRPAPRLRCLGQRFGEPKRIYACGDFVLDGYSLYSTDDGGQTFTPVMKFTDILGPLTCAAVSSNCAAHWERIKGVLGIGAPIDAGQGDAGNPPPPSSPGGSCVSLSADAAALLVLLAFSLRRAKS
jgi:photosystem II stability/assembly factor-like uncharacterized protein